MNWDQQYLADNEPSEKDISNFISNPIWEELNTFLQESYEVQPSYSYSSCSDQPGWNVKYQKAGRSLCTLYPMQGFFIALVVIGTKEKDEAEFLAPSFSPHVQELLKTAGGLAGARWLMINVTSRQTLEDVKQLIQLRRPIKKKRSSSAPTKNKS